MQLVNAFPVRDKRSARLAIFASQSVFAAAAIDVVDGTNEMIHAEFNYAISDKIGKSTL